MTMKWAAAAAAIGLAISLSACETATPYQPLVHGTKVSGGFTDQRLDADHFRVSFQGNTLTSRATVETYLLYRSAELTVAQGFDWFETVERHTDRDKRTYVDDPFYGAGFGYGYFRPSWSFYGGFGRRGFGPGFGYGGFGGFGPFDGFGDFDVHTVEKFQATAEIVMHHGPKPQGNARAFDAHEVVANLGPKVQRPTP